MILGTVDASLLENMLTGKEVLRGADGGIRVDEGVIIAGHDF